jgi:hypothetical protein
MKKKKAVPAMYPKPESIKLKQLQKIVAIDRRTKTYSIEASPALLTQALLEIERHRFDLIAGLPVYKTILLARVAPPLLRSL